MVYHYKNGMLRRRYSCGGKTSSEDLRPDVDLSESGEVDAAFDLEDWDRYFR